MDTLEVEVFVTVKQNTSFLPEPYPQGLIRVNMALYVLWRSVSFHR